MEFATNIADNIVKYAKTTYSSNLSNKISNGVYIKTFSKQNVKDSKAEAISKGYKPYKIDTSTTYYYMLRETGDIATNAYIDGRNKKTGNNIYYDSNIETESYLIELGYINFKSNLNNILYNKSNYIKGIVESIKKELDI